MALSTTQIERQFVNITDDPSVGRDERRIYVRRTVMTEYHKRQQRHRNDGKGQENFTPQNPIQPLCFAQPRPSHLLRPRSWASTGHARTSQLIISFLCGQTVRASRDLSDVSFIHWQSRDTPAAGMGVDSLSLCHKTLRGYDNLNVATHPQEAQLWDEIQSQQERIYTQSDTWEALELLSAAQAITIYLLLRLKAKTNHSNFPSGDIALLFTLGKVFKLLQGQRLHDASSNVSMGLADNWQRWIFQESIMRTAMVYFILTICVSMELGIACDRPSDWHVDDLPVPASKASWMAKNEVAWRSSFDNALTLPHHLTFGHLCSNRDSHQHRIERWQEASDEMGLVVAMASHLKTAAV